MICKENEIANIVCQINIHKYTYKFLNLPQVLWIKYLMRWNVCGFQLKVSVLLLLFKHTNLIIFWKLYLWHIQILIFKMTY